MERESVCQKKKDENVEYASEQLSRRGPLSSLVCHFNSATAFSTVALLQALSPDPYKRHVRSFIDQLAYEIHQSPSRLFQRHAHCPHFHCIASVDHSSTVGHPYLNDDSLLCIQLSESYWLTPPSSPGGLSHTLRSSF